MMGKTKNAKIITQKKYIHIRSKKKGSMKMFPKKIIVKTNKGKTKITKEQDNIIYLDVHSPPINNKANIEILKFLKKHFKTSLKITKGLKSKQKIIDKTQ